MQEPTFTVKTDTQTQDHGVFVIEPLSQGYGQTLGNSLRRVLLTSLSGSAITSVRIEGVKHQYSSLPGLKEDIVELMLNIKRIRLSVPEGEPVVLTLSKTGPCVVTAGDIDVPAGVVISNPDLVLGTLSDKKAVLEMKMNAGRGYGYVTSDEFSVNEVGVIALDALFSPVTRVNYRVEATRVGRMTNLDKLIMEIWTDGTIEPRAALTSAAKLLVSYVSQVYEERTSPVAAPAAITAAVSDETLKTRIEELDVPTRIVNALSNGGIDTIGQLMAAPRTDLMKIKNLGAKSLSVVEDKLKEKGITLNA
jgi:DNA-directed RNA polymerase subunit alpha